MRDLVRFLLTRMETHPEEFYQDRKTGVKYNWSHQVKDNKKFMTEDEYKAVWSKYSEINLNRTMQEITERLLAPEPRKEEFTQESLVEAVKNSYALAGNPMPSRIALSRTQIELMKQQMKHEVDTYKYATKGRYESSEN